MIKQDAPPFELLIESVIWEKQKGLKPRLKQAAAATLAHLPAPLQRFARQTTWTILLTTDAAVHQLNKDFRAVDKPTNVLSFPQFSPETLHRIARHKVFDKDTAASGVQTPSKARDLIPCGDIAVSSRYVFREAKAEGKDPLDHLTHLVIHGLLHLFGYDHMTETEAVHMEKLETKIMAALGLPDPYADTCPDTCPATCLASAAATRKIAAKPAVKKPSSQKTKRVRP